MPAHSARSGVVSENGIYGHSRFCNTDFDDKLACLNLSG
ncbi:cation transporter, partial [Enterobacter hormaechei]